MFTRLLSAAVAGTAITAGLLYLMHVLIETGEAAIVDSRDVPTVIWGRPMEDSPVEEIREEVIEPIDPVETLPQPRIVDNADFGTVLPVPPLAPPTIERTGISLDGRHIDGALMTIVAVEPAYPANALARGVEGFVDVQFDVTAAGTVTNAVVIGSSSRLFHRAALAAAERFRFKPRVVDGMPQPVSGVQRRFTFTIDND